MGTPLAFGKFRAAYIFQTNWNFFKITLPEYVVSASFHPFTSLNGYLNSSQMVKNFAPELKGSGAFFLGSSGNNQSYLRRQAGMSEQAARFMWRMGKQAVIYSAWQQPEQYAHEAHLPGNHRE